MRSAVDTNIILDVLTGDSVYSDMSRTALEGALIRGKVMICEIVYADLAAAFDVGGNLLDSFLDDIGVAFEASSKEIFLKAGRIWRQSGRRKFPGRVLPDFIVGAHARTNADCLISRDRGFYAKCFEGLLVVDPSRL